MKVTNGDIWQGVDALSQICKAEWPVKISYRLARLTRKVGNARKDIDEVRIALIQRYGVPNGQGQLQVTIDNPAYKEFAQALNDLMTEETEIDYGPVELPTDGYKVKADLLLAAGPLLTVEGEQ